jgi:hypothetical protein
VQSATPSPGAACSSQDDKAVIVENLGVQGVLGKRYEYRRDHQVDPSFLQGAVHHRSLADGKVKDDFRRSPGQLIDDGRHEACRDRDRAPDPQLWLLG